MGKETTEQRDAFLHSFVCHSIDGVCPGFESRSSWFVTVGKETTEQRDAFLHGFVCHSMDGVCPGFESRSSGIVTRLDTAC